MKDIIPPAQELSALYTYIDIEEILEENQNLLDTFQVIYDKLGIKEGEVPGNEKVSVTVMKKINQIIAESKKYEN